MPALRLNFLAVNEFDWNFPAGVKCGRCVVDHGVGVLDAHAVRSSVLLDDIHHGRIRIPLRPVALPLQHHLNPGDWFRSSLLHPPHGSLVNPFIQIAAEIFDDIHLVAVMDRLNGCESDADFGSEPCKRNFFGPRLLYRRHEFLVVPRGHGGALNWSVVGINCLQLRPKISAE